MSIRIVKNPLRCWGKPTVGETRICVHDVIASLRSRRWSVRAVHADYPHRSVEGIAAAADYYRSHRAEIDGILRRMRRL